MSADDELEVPIGDVAQKRPAKKSSAKPATKETKAKEPKPPERLCTICLAVLHHYGDVCRLDICPCCRRIRGEIAERAMAVLVTRGIGPVVGSKLAFAWADAMLWHQAAPLKSMEEIAAVEASVPKAAMKASAQGRLF